MCVVYDIGFNGWRCSLEALAVDNAGAGLVVLLLGDPHLLEGGEGSHGGATGEDGVGVKVLAEIDVRLHDGVEAALVDTDDLHAQESGAEHGLGAAETLVANGD